MSHSAPVALRPLAPLVRKMICSKVTLMSLLLVGLQCSRLVLSIEQSSPTNSFTDEELSLVDEDRSATSKHSNSIDPFAYTFEDYLREVNDGRAMSDESKATNKQSTGESEQENEIRSQFAWKRTPTNRCSKSCGAGRRVYHLSCVDLKYGVRVEEALCRRQLSSTTSAQITGTHQSASDLFTQYMPSELSEEPCNQIDCEPQWNEIVAVDDSCNRTGSSNNNSKTCLVNKLFKRLECQMIDRAGKRVQVDEWRCGDVPAHLRPEVAQKAPSVDTAMQDSAPKTQSGSSIEDEQLILDSDDNRVVVDSARSSSDQTMDNLIRQSTRPHSKALNTGQHQHPTSGEPHYIASDWSDCSGAQCAQLGRRRRKLTCRIYLARSSKFAELPLSNCEALSLVKPDTEQPCYMDCAPEVDSQHSSNGTANLIDEQFTGSEQSNSTNTTNESTEDNNNSFNYGDETVYDLDAARYVWRRDDWTQCSAECLGGERESIVECWDKVAAQPVEGRHCSDSQRPDVLVEICNERPCAPEWRTEPFDDSLHTCSRPCGSAGVRTRPVVCVQQVGGEDESGTQPMHFERIITNSKGEHWLIVPDEFCVKGGAGQMPARSEPCHRWDCEPKWHLSQWSSCSRKCGLGARNRTATCVQEFAKRDAPVGVDQLDDSSWRPKKIPTPDLLEAMALSAINWHPGKLTQVPFRECYDHYRSVPILEEHCYGHECNQMDYMVAGSREDQSTSHWIDSEPAQDYRMSMDLGANTRRRTVTLKIGGRAKILEGKNLKLRCRLMQASGRIGPSGRHPMNYAMLKQRVEWRKDGVRIFAENSTVAEKKPIVFDDNNNDNETTDQAHNSIWADQVLLADQPATQASPSTTKNPSKSTAAASTSQQQLSRQSKNVRSLSAHNSLATLVSNFEFVPQSTGRFALIKDNTLRIRRLRSDDSGLYTCHWGSSQESIELNVVSRRELAHYEDNM